MTTNEGQTTNQESAGVGALQDLSNAFGYHPANNTTGPLHQNVRQMFRDLAHFVENLEGGPTRHKSLAITKLEEAMHWANAHIAIHHPAASPVQETIPEAEPGVVDAPGPLTSGGASGGSK